MQSSVVALLQAPDPGALADLVSASVCFHSPVADYTGRRDVVHLLSLIADVLQDLHATRVLQTSTSQTTFVEAMVKGRPIQGVFDEHHDASGQVVEATLMLRPLGALRKAVAAMAQALDDDPLPSQSS